MNVATFLQILASTAFHNLGTVCGCFTFEKTSSRPTVPPCYLTWSSSAFIWRNVWFVHCSQHYVLVVQTWPPFLLRNSSPWTQNGFGNPQKKYRFEISTPHLFVPSCLVLCWGYFSAKQYPLTCACTSAGAGMRGMWIQKPLHPGMSPAQLNGERHLRRWKRNWEK